MKKYILIASIAIIAVLNFTLVKSKTGEVTLKSITELSKANAEEVEYRYSPWEFYQTRTRLEYVPCKWILDNGSECGLPILKTVNYDEYRRFVFVWSNFYATWVPANPDREAYYVTLSEEYGRCAKNHPLYWYYPWHI